MKRFPTLILVLIIGGMLHSAMWNTYTNTSHIYDVKFLGYDVLAGTWGGAFLNIHTDGLNMGNSIWLTKDGLSANDIRSVEVSSTGTIWLGTSTEGVSIVSSNGIQIVNDTNGLPSNKIRQIISKGDLIYVATDMGLSVFNYLSGVAFPLLLHQYNNQNTSGGLVANDIADMSFTTSGYLYLSTISGLSYVHQDSLDIDEAWRKWTSANSPLPTGVAYRLSANNEHLALSTINRVFKRKVDPFDGGWTVYDINDGIVNHQISNLLLDRQERLWIAYGAWNEDQLRYDSNTDTLITRIDSDGQIKHYSKNLDGMGRAVISSMTQEENGLMCFGTWGDGYYFFYDADTLYLNSNNEIAFPKVVDIKTDANHKTWFSNGNIGVTPVRKSTLGVSMLSGNTWTTYNTGNSPLHSDNILSIAIDSHNRKWFGTWDVIPGISPTQWKNGVSIYDDRDDTWKYLNNLGVANWDATSGSWSSVVPGSMTILANTIGAITLDKQGNMLVGCSGRGVSVINSQDQNVSNFTIPNSSRQSILYLYHSGSQYFIGTNNDRGLVIWNHDSIPQTDGDHWLLPSPQELNNCIVYGIVTIDTPYEGKQHWIAASTGLFMWNESDWFKYDTTIKRSIYRNDQWENETLYYVDENRLFGSVRTTPTAILLDPFNRIWIGSLENGLSKYDPQTERFTNYFMANSPLLSAYVTSLGYDGKSGNLLIGTPDGLNTLQIGKTIITTTKLNTVKAFPNPFRPDQDGITQIVNLPEKSMPFGKNYCRIYDAAGALVIELKQNEFARFDWDGNNKAGAKCSSGVYFFVVLAENGDVKRGKIALIR